MTDKFVLIIGNDGRSGPLFGPYDYNEAKRVLFEVLQSNRTDNGPVEITDEICNDVELNDGYSFEDGGGVYIVEAEIFTPIDGVETSDC